MALNTVNDVPNIAERIRSACSRNDFRLVDVSKKRVPNFSKFLVENLLFFIRKVYFNSGKCEFLGKLTTSLIH